VRVALDTNVLIAAVATRGLCADLFHLVLAEHELIVGETVLAELRRKLAEKFRVPAKVIDEFVALIAQEGEIVKKTENLEVAIRDKDDIPVVSEAVAGNAEVLVTGDKDILDVAEELPVRALSPRGFWDELRKNNSQA
jgi:putative PIN family toxin of toxin-antitoxin system